MTTIFFNPWDEKYKRPFGAIEAGSFTKFTIDGFGEGIIGINLVIQREGGEEHRIAMEDFASQRYTYDFFFNEGKGLYFYYFEIIYWNQNNEEVSRYYGAADTGGPGLLLDNRRELRKFQVTCYSQDETAPAWYRDAVFYQIFPDRFFNGSPDGSINSPKPNTFIYGTQQDDPMYIKDAAGEVLRWDFFGGNFKGIEAKIPYLKELGVNAIYLNPIFKAHSNHRYDTGDYLEVDPVLGTEGEFEELLRALHENGMRVILDGVFSHVGRNSIYFNYDGTYGEQSGAYRDINSPYYPWFTFTEYPNEYRAWWDVKDLPEVNKHNPDFQEFIYGRNGVLSKWNRLGVDGWRLDVADELPDEFIHGIRHNLNEFPEKMLIGEVWEDASNKVSYDVRRQYILGEHLQGVMNYPLRNAVMTLLRGEDIPESIALSYTKLQENYPKAVFHNSFNNIGTHDTERILTILEGDREKLNLAFAMLYLFPGVPCLYYGDEAGVTGGKDPENRKFYPWGHVDDEVFQMVSKWIKLRQEANVLKDGEFRLIYSEKLLGILRFDKEEYLLAFINPTNGLQRLSAAELHAPLGLPFTEEKMLELCHDQLLDEKSVLLIQGKF